MTTPDNTLLLDGGTGRELQRVGAPFKQPEWSALALIEAPHFVSLVHQRYVDAGADVITTNSYAVVPFHIGEARFAAQGEALAALAGQLARAVADAAPRPVRVAGSLPPVCGSYRADLFDTASARPILEVLVRGLRPYVDHWQAETLSAIEEAELVRAVIGDDGKALWLSFTLQDDTVVAGDPRLRSGQTVADAVAAALRLGASALLFNCSQPEVMADAVAATQDRLTAEKATLRIGVYANAFPPQRKDAEANSGLDEIRADLTPEGYLAWAGAWRTGGASIIGGCCGIGPEHIAAIRADLDRCA
ncbi:homocysteine S-methyltransferase family protein [Rhodocyclus gracilis]|uniref:Homocysteine S-methyltransferase n=1 Tax=Rhodocyclus tenuis TaxID=1066 RepID=A0A6L5JTP4_RHOTE|nr:homocysteine S-methyltransferase family protein [Rhodocyclus gracilis]MQY50202.1 homocysteine S-methyltransferase [Rhodocyclus gracilis]